MTPVAVQLEYPDGSKRIIARIFNTKKHGTVFYQEVAEPTKHLGSLSYSVITTAFRRAVETFGIQHLVVHEKVSKARLRGASYITTAQVVLESPASSGIDRKSTQFFYRIPIGKCEYLDTNPLYSSFTNRILRINVGAPIGRSIPEEVEEA
jgi:hypothetical protein